MSESLWGDEFDLPDKKAEKEKVKQIKEKIAKPKEIKSVTVEKVIKSKTVSLADKLKLIEENVLKTLGKQKDNILCIKDKDTFHDYITKAIDKGIIAIDTETNNSLDPITCKLMGPCIYTPGEKQAYIPINHRDPNTKERLTWQLTEKDVEEEFQRLLDAQTFTITHNGKFDYQVIKCTCNGLEIRLDWDTMIGAKLLDENEKSAGLKQQYIDKIDPDQEKYSIDHLFEGVEYADVDPEIFTFYSATDASMTYKLYEWQMDKFKDPDLSRVLNLARTVEMPLVKVIAEMELAGMAVDMEYAKNLSVSFHKKLDKIDSAIAIELEKLKPQIDAWKLTPDALTKPKKKNGDGEGKSKSEQLEDPINLGSPTQLAILFYDILKAPIVDKKQPRATGEEALKAIGEKLKLGICNLLLDRREVVKLITTYIDPIPELAKQWPDGRVRTHFQQYGADTGRLSSGGRIVFGPGKEYGGLNFQNVPSHSKAIRMLFCAPTAYHDVDMIDDYYEIPETDEVMINFKDDASSWKSIAEISVDDLIVLDDELVKVKNIIKNNNLYKLYI